MPGLQTIPTGKSSRIIFLIFPGKLGKEVLSNIEVMDLGLSHGE
jgi:hypothetical protein